VKKQVSFREQKGIYTAFRVDERLDVWEFVTCMGMRGYTVIKDGDSIVIMRITSGQQRTATVGQWIAVCDSNWSDCHVLTEEQFDLQSVLPRELLLEWWIYRAVDADGGVEWQFSDGPEDRRRSSEDYGSMEEGMAALSPAVFHFVMDWEN
jgi:hypothetical protein